MLRISGEIDLSTAPRLAHALFQLPAPGVPLIADLTEVGFMDSAGTRVLMVANRQAADQGTRLLMMLSAFVARVIEIAGLRPLFHVCTDLPGALEAARGLLAPTDFEAPPPASV